MGEGLGKNNLVAKYIIILIIIFGLVVRLIAINQSLWLDEAIGALVARDLSIKDMFDSFFTADNHPPLYYFCLKLWTYIFGYSELSIRFPSLLFGIATIYIVYLITTDIFKDRKLGVVSALLMATSQFHIYYSQEARMYSMAAFFASLSIFSYLKVMVSNYKLKYWLLFSVAVTLMIATDYVPIFLIPVFFIYALINKKDKNWWINFFLSFTPLIILGYFWLPILLRQTVGGEWLLKTVPTWKKVAGGADFKQLALVWIKFTLGRISIVNKTYYYLVVLLSSISFVVIFINSIKSVRKYMLIFLWLSVPIALSFFVSFIFPLFIYFRFLYVIPAFYIITGIGILKLKSKIVSVFLYISILLINIGAWLIYINNPFQQREQWRQAVSYIEDKVKPNEITAFSYPEAFAPYRWYEKKPEIAFGATNSIFADKEVSKNRMENRLSGVNGIYYFEYLKEISDPGSVVLTTIKGEGYQEREKLGNFSGVGYIYYFTR